MAVYTTAAALNAANLGTRVDRASATLPATTQTAYFHVYGGRCMVTLMLGEVTTIAINDWASWSEALVSMVSTPVVMTSPTVWCMSSRLSG